MSETAPRPNRALLLKLAVAAAVVVAGGLLLAWGFNLKALVQQGLELIRSAGAVTFFVAMTLLPAVGAPLSFFSLTAGSVFGPQLGMPAVLALSLGAIITNMVLSYFLASRAFRPLLERLVKLLGYRLPQVDSGDATDLIVLLRVTPGVPFPVQNYLLGLAGVPFVRYLVVSALIQLPINAAVILFGDALLHGKGKIAFVSLLLLLALMAGTHLVRKHYGAKKKAG
ncbi:MAG: hypothetical protein QG602_21 [Verrucomicrobiota bacterium]|nr:hypothetical protein [Verrucomicrobiota bacterium]